MLVSKEIESDMSHENWDNEGYLGYHIPLFEISHKDANKIKTALAESKVYIKVQTSATSSINHVEVDLWYSSSLDLGLKLSDELAALSISFHNDHSSKPLFTPRIATFSCPDCSADFQQLNCFSQGNHCAYTPKFYDAYKAQNRNFEITGRSVLLQALREKCLHSLVTNKYKDEGDLFWTFFKYLDDCFLEKGAKVNSLEQCFDWSTVIINGNEEVNAINDCVDSSFTTPKDYSAFNSLLEADRLWSQSLNLKFHPSVVVNNVTF